MESLSQVVSADSHVIEPGDLWTSRVPRKLSSLCPRLVQTDDGESRWTAPGQPPMPSARAVSRWTERVRRWNGGGDTTGGFSSPADRLRDQFEDGVDAEVLYPSDGVWRLINGIGDRRARLACVRAFNEYVAELSSHAPDRLLALGKIPTTGVEDAVAELRWCADRGLPGVILDSWPSGETNPNPPEDERFWRAAGEIGLPVSIHGGFQRQNVILDDPHFAGEVPAFFTSLAASLAFGGVLDRCPNLRLVLAHVDAGWAPAMLDSEDGRYVKGVVRRKASLPNPDWLPSDYVRHFFWFTFHNDRVAVFNRRIISRIHLMWASYAPLVESSWPNDRAEAELLAMAAGEDAEALFGQNCARLYGLSGTKDFSPEEVGDYERVMLF